MSEGASSTVRADGDHVGYVYFIHAPSVNRVKIGYASHDPNQRFVDINIGSPVRLKRHSLIRAPRSMERELHRKFKKYRKKGEWFRVCEPILSYIVANARDWVELLNEEKVARDRANEEHFGRLNQERGERYHAKQWEIAREIMKDFDPLGLAGSPSIPATEPVTPKPSKPGKRPKLPDRPKLAKVPYKIRFAELHARLDARIAEVQAGRSVGDP